jgi:5'-nucleotidase (lipoprotein e(P4) family)
MKRLMVLKLGVVLALQVTMMVLPASGYAQGNPEQSVMATLWFQRSAEYRALCYQAYNLAEWRIKEYLTHPDTAKPAAVIFDIDETLLDNSPSEAINILENKPFTPAGWKAWTDQASAAPIPGGLDFCKFLAQNGIQVIYVSNRLINETESTLLNLQKWGFPNADPDHLFLKSDVSSKEIRRNLVEASYNVIMLVGDNLSDFDQVFEDRSVNFGYGAVDSLRSELGKKLIVLPNPLYGDWTKPLKGDKKGWLIR